MPKARSVSVVAAFVVGLAVSQLFFQTVAARAEPSTDPCAPPSEATPPPPPAPEPPPAEPVPPPTEPPVIAAPSIRLSEVFPDPEGSDAEQEFIELVNLGEEDAALAGWRLFTASGKTFDLALTIAPHGRHAIAYAESKIALVNSGMTLSLADPQGAIVDAVTYGAAKEGKAYARTDGGEWRWTSTPTPGEANRFDAETPPTEPTPEPAPAPAPPPPPPSEPVPVPPAPQPPPADLDVAIVAFMPDPVGDDAAGEWVRLANAGAVEARLDGWKLDDAEGGSTPFSLAGLAIAPGATLTLPRSLTKLALNNDADAVRLFASDGTLRQAVPYSQPPEGKSYERIDGEWRWLPEEPSAQPAVAGAAAASPPPAANGKAEEEIEPRDIADLDAASDELVAVEAVVTVPPGTLGKRTFAAQQRDAAAGMFVRAYGRDAVPELASGDVVRIVGRSRSERGVMAFSTLGRSIERIGRSAVAYAERTVGELSDADDGLAVTVGAVVTHRGKAALMLADEAQDNEVEVRLRTASFPGAVAGASVVVRGVARARAGKIELVAFGKDAVEVVAPPAAESDAMVENDEKAGPLPTPAREPMVFGSVERKRPTKFVVAAFAAAFLAATAFIIMRRRQADALESGADR